MKITLNELRKIIKRVILENLQNYNVDDLRNYAIENNIKQSEEDIKYTNPNFEFEWEEATRYKIFNILGHNFYLNRSHNNHIVDTLYLKGKLSNTDLYNAEEAFNNLELEKRKRFFKALKNKTFERSIAIKLNENRYDLLAGNTRLTGLAVINLQQEICVIDLSDIVNGTYEGWKNFSENKIKYYNKARQQLIDLL
jgi:hypothetical protein